MRTIIPILLNRAARRRLLAAASLVLAAGARLKAQECPEFRPLPEHAVLAAAEGDFDLDFGSPEGIVGTSSCKSDLGGQWLVEHVKTRFHDKPYEGRGATSYDPARKKYIGVWIDSVSPVPLVTEGTYDKSRKTLTLVGDMVAPDGSVAKATLVTVYKDADTRTFTMSVGGPGSEQVALFQITYTRRAR